MRAAWLFLFLVAPAPAAAQLAGHPMLGLRPFHERLAAAEIAAVVEVEQIDEGRIRVRRERVLAGAPPERFEVKRSPLAPPPLATGDRALLLLRGKRPPYVFADRPDEVIRLADDAMAARWSEAVTAALARRDEPERLVPLYLGWIDAGPETLADIARSSLLDLAGEHPELTAEIGAELTKRSESR